MKERLEPVRDVDQAAMARRETTLAEVVPNARRLEKRPDTDAFRGSCS
jgi:hypothetical protein